MGHKHLPPEPGGPWESETNSQDEAARSWARRLFLSPEPSEDSFLKLSFIFTGEARGANTPASKINSCSLQKALGRPAHRAHGQQTCSADEQPVWPRHRACRPEPGMPSVARTGLQLLGRAWGGLTAGDAGRWRCREQTCLQNSQTHTTDLGKGRSINGASWEPTVELGGPSGSGLCLPISTTSFG